MNRMMHAFDDEGVSLLINTREKRVEVVFREKTYMQRVDKSDKRWLCQGQFGRTNNSKNSPQLPSVQL